MALGAFLVGFDGLFGRAESDVFVRSLGFPLFGLAFHQLAVVGVNLFRLGKEPQRGVGDLQYVLALVDLEREMGRHAGQELEFRIRRRHDHRISHHVLRRGRVHANLVDDALEQIVRIGVDREMHFLALFLRLVDQPDVGLVDRGEDVHLFFHVGGHHEQLGRLERGGQRLALVDLPIDHDPVAGGYDIRIVEIGLRVFQPGLGLLDPRLGQGDLGHARLRVVSELIHLGVGDVVLVLRLQCLGPLLVVFGLLQQGLTTLDFGFASGQHGVVPIESRLVDSRVDLGQQLALLDLLVEIRLQLHNRPGNKRADLDPQHRLHGTRRVDDRDDITPGDLHLAILRLVTRLPPAPKRHEHGRAR